MILVEFEYFCTCNRNHHFIMDKRAYLLSIILCLALFSNAQTPTQFATDREINGIKLGYSYTIDELKKILGEPTSCYFHGEAGDEGSGTTIQFKSTKIRMDYRNIVVFIKSASSDFTIKPYSFIQYGKSISCIELIPNTVLRKDEENAVWLYINTGDGDPMIVLFDKDTQKITGVSFSLYLEE